MIDGEVGAEFVVDVPQEKAAGGPSIAIASPHAIEASLDIAVAHQPVHDQLSSRVGSQGNIALQGKRLQVVVAEARANADGVFLEARARAMHLDGSADGVASEQGSLGAAQDLDSFDVDEIQHVTR